MPIVKKQKDLIDMHNQALRNGQEIDSKPVNSWTRTKGVIFFMCCSNGLLVGVCRSLPSKLLATPYMNPLLATTASIIMRFFLAT
ncbi:hypothetical protein F4780DRAFT_744773 [Xylariomycetidae sp. FL0641]|nr:hypothetical protein F4780DRAFT_744773 [Xylariomycetidae sp. FL0641]